MLNVVVEGSERRDIVPVLFWIWGLSSKSSFSSLSLPVLSSSPYSGEYRAKKATLLGVTAFQGGFPTTIEPQDSGVKTSGNSSSQ